MKQIRKGTFETNSSSTHSLTIKKLNEFPNIKDIVGDTIVVGLIDPNDIQDKINSYIKKFTTAINSDVHWQERLDYFWWCVHNTCEYDCSVSKHIMLRSFISKVFEKYGVSVKFDDNYEKYEYGYAYVRFAAFEEIVSELEKDDYETFENMFLSYLFGDIYGYNFCDEGVCGELYDEYTKDIDENLKSFIGEKCYVYETRC